MIAAVAIIVVSATVLARVVAKAGMSNTNVTLVVLGALVATVAAGACAVAG